MLLLFPDLEEKLEEAFGSGDTVATRWTLNRSLRQDYIGIPGRGQRITVEGMNFYRLKDGRITGIWSQFDAAGMMQQLNAA